MFCGNCGKDIGDAKVCPFCNPDLGSQNSFNNPDEEDSRTVLLSGPSTSQPEASLSGAVSDDDSHTVLLSGVDSQQDPFASMNGDDDSHTVLFSDPSAASPEGSLGGQSDDDSHTVLFSDPSAAAPESSFGMNHNPYSAPSNPSYPPVNRPSQPAPVPNPSYQYQPAAPTPGFVVPPTGEPEKKKSKKGLIIGLVIGLVILLAGGGVLAWILTAPMRNYNKAMDLKDEGSYEEAIEILTDLEDYEDAPEQITDCRYLNAIVQIDEGNYEDARTTLTELGDYKESKDQLDRCNYLDAKKMLEDGNYDDAKTAFKALGTYEDSAELVKECDYQKASKLLTDKKYTEAKKLFQSLNGYSKSKDKIKECDYNIAKGKIESSPADAIDLLEDLGNYEDSKELLKQAKMNYCKKNKDYKNSTTYKYLKELKSAKYSGAEALYNELYTPKIVNVYWNTDSDDETTKKTKISEGDDAVLHFELANYTPDTYYFEVTCEVFASNGVSLEKDMSGIYHRFVYTLTGAPKGELKVVIYDKDGKKLHTATVQIV